MSYNGAPVSGEFVKRWRTKKHVAGSAPWAQVLIRRGRFERFYHDGDWPDPQFGQVAGHPITHQWYPDWTPETDSDGVTYPWVELPGVAKIDLVQSFDKNGSTVATLDVDNVAFVEAAGHDGLLYHTRERGWLWPWRGWVPAHRPGSGETRNQWYGRGPYALPNAQILIRQGYGPDTAVKTFTGLIDNLAASVRPDRMTIVARDFGGVLTDSFLFGWNKAPHLQDPFTFVAPDYAKLPDLKANAANRYVIIEDASDIVRCALRWCGFKEWEVQDAGVNITTTYRVDKSKPWSEVINDVATATGFVFFIAEPSEDDDLSIGRPIFRAGNSMKPGRLKPWTLRDADLLTDLKPVHDNTDDRYIIRVRGTTATKAHGGELLHGDPTTGRRFTFTYWPPWMAHMAGIIKQLTYYNIGSNAVLGFTSVQQCMVAAVLIAYHIALARDTATAQVPGNPGIGLDGFAYVVDSGTGVTSRLYVTNRQSTMELGGDGSGLASSGYQSGGQASDSLRWATEIGGPLVDNPEWEHLVKDHDIATSGGQVQSWGTPY